MRSLKKYFVDEGLPTLHNTHTVSPLQFQKKNKLEKRSLVPCSKTAIPFALTKGGIHSERRIQTDQHRPSDEGLV